jgi:hypothetical protein
MGAVKQRRTGECVGARAGVAHGVTAAVAGTSLKYLAAIVLGSRVGRRVGMGIGGADLGAIERDVTAACNSWQHDEQGRTNGGYCGFGRELEHG